MILLHIAWIGGHVSLPYDWPPTLKLYVQKSMAYTEDQEDVVSMSLTVVQNLMEKYEIQPETVGR